MTEMIQISQNEQIWHFPSDWIWMKEMLIQQYSMEKKQIMLKVMLMNVNTIPKKHE